MAVGWALRLALWLIAPLMVAVSAASLAGELVLVAAASSDMTPLTPLEIRKVFLGYPVKKSGQDLSAIRNMSDDKAYQVFLQKIIHLSARNYERRLLSKTFRTGTPNVSSESSLKELVHAVTADNNRITFAWRDDIASHPDIRIIQTLYEGVQR